MASDHEVLINSANFIVMRLLLRKKSRRKHYWWITSVFRSRDRYSGSDLVCDLRVENWHFKLFCRMSCSGVDTLINLVGPRISNKYTLFRKAIPVAEGLAVPLRSLAFFNSFTILSFIFKISKESFPTIIHFLFHFYRTDAKFCRNFLPRVIFLYSQVHQTYVCCPRKPHVFLTH